MKQMSAAEFGAATVSRAWEPPEEVVVSRPLAYAEGLQPEDYGVLIRLLLRDPNQPSGMTALAEEFKATGWKMGESRLRGVMARLKKAGHVSHEQVGYDPVAKRPVWAFTVFRNPANNPQHARVQGASAQVSPTGGFSTDESDSSITHPWDFNVLAGQTLSLDSNVSNTHLLDSNALESNRCAGQADTAISNGWVGHPPHPPEEVETSSPYPLAGTAGYTAPSAREEAEGCSTAEAAAAEAVAAADRFLQELPSPWTAGRVTARKLAPLLATTAADQGWELDDALVSQLTRNPEGVKRFPATLRVRIEDLPRRMGRRQELPPQRVPKPDPEFTPVPAPDSIKELLAGLKRPNI
ncbi:hypothetical protein [Streptomyces sp. V1I6]|uniref:hypothetical protein n=1 Tax=Streptomyces sp. V1I6 TaxID=3042273 RepID=UPI0027814A22|nr:hypothetical protein [Streptomyces sp. V1I6]MDQ0847710.1 hypothetical protein [Streptomyces sp. V1I6]